MRLTAATITDEQAGETGCPKCGVACGTRCTAMTHSGYKPIKRAHLERRIKVADILNARDNAVAEQADGMVQPFCACGRRWSECDRSRIGCNKAVSKLTAETITDEQIRELLTECRRHEGGMWASRALECEAALFDRASLGAARAAERRQLARARCAEILNVSGKAVSK